jgi:hypothetical protein
MLQLHILNSPPPAAVSFCTAHTCATVPFNRYAATTARGSLPAQNEWYYSHDQSKGIGAVVNIMSLDSDAAVNISIEYGPDAIDASAFNGVSLSLKASSPLHPSHPAAGSRRHPPRTAR